jgi:3-oxoacyl-[acyl-carrier protein] reductase
MSNLDELWKKRWLFKSLEKLGVSIPAPPELRRDTGPEVESPLVGRWVIAPRSGGWRGREVLQSLARAGAGFIVPDGDDAATYLMDIGVMEGVSTRRELLAESADICVFDTTGFQKIDELEELFAFLHSWARRIGPCGRVIVLAPAPDVSSAPSYHALVGALTGFVRAYSKEEGLSGTTVHLVLVPSSTRGYLEPLARFLASGRSAYITGQVWSLSKLEPNRERFRTVMALEKKVALVTGASRGIGEASARCLAREGAEVVLVDRPEAHEKIREVSADIRGVPLIADLTWPGAPAFIAGEVQKRFGKIDILVHNAGVYLECRLASMTPETWKSVWDVNLGAVIRLTQALDPLLRDGGRIVGIGSIAGLTGIGGQTCYSGSKAGLMEYLRALARAMEGRTVAVNAIAAGHVRTSLTSGIPWWQDEIGQRMSALMQGGIPEDIGNFVVFLTGPGAASLNGQVIRACGGHLIGA